MGYIWTQISLDINVCTPFGIYKLMHEKMSIHTKIFCIVYTVNVKSTYLDAVTSCCDIRAAFVGDFPAIARQGIICSQSVASVCFSQSRERIKEGMVPGDHHHVGLPLHSWLFRLYVHSCDVEVDRSWSKSQLQCTTVKKNNIYIYITWVQM